MSVPDLLYARLSGDANVNTAVASRIYPLVLPQSPTYPCIVQTLVSVQKNLTLDTDTDGKSRSRVEVSVWDPVRANAESVQELVRVSLESATTFRALQVFSYDLYDFEMQVFVSLSDYSVYV